MSTELPNVSSVFAPGSEPGAGGQPSGQPAVDVAALKGRLAEVRQRIAAAAKKTGRSGESIVLIAVTKHAEPDQIRELIRLGQADLGENRVQQLLQRAAMIEEWLARHRSMPGLRWQTGVADPLAPGAKPSAGTVGGAGGAGAGGMPQSVRWHMIGHLQRNKARKAIDVVRLIHSIDSLRLAEELQGVALKREKPVEVLLQVNCSLEAQKYGCAIAAAPHLVEQMETMVHVQCRGLMTMAAHTEDPEKARGTFARCRELFDEIRASGGVPGRFNILSMGMSNDYEVAIEEGSNMVRVGTALFGEPKGGAESDEDEDD